MRDAISANRTRLTAARLGIFACAVLLVTLMPAASAQLRDEFEGGSPRWRVWRSDGAAQILRQDLTAVMPAAGTRSESIEVHTDRGEMLQLIYPLPFAAALIPEFTATVSVRSAVSGFRLGFRVRYPAEEGVTAATSPAVAVLATQPVYGGGGRWQPLTIANWWDTYQAQLRLASVQAGHAIDIRGAYIDAIVLEIGNGAGTTLLQIDSLSADNLVNAAGEIAVAQQLPAAAPIRTQDLPTQLFDLSESLPRWAIDRGESPSTLLAAGLNGVIVSDATSAERTAELSRRLTVISTAAPATGIENSAEQTASTQPHVWLLAEAATERELPAVRQLSRELSQRSSSRLRPTFVEAMQSPSLFGRTADVVAIPLPYATSFASNDQLRSWLREEFGLLRGRALPLATVLTDPPPSLRRQSELLGVSPSPLQSLDLLRIGDQSVQAVASGAKGVLYRSNHSLQSDRQPQDLGSLLRFANSQLQLLQPWLAHSRTEQTDSPDGGRVTQWIAQRGRLYLIQSTAAWDHIAGGEPPPRYAATLPRGSDSQRLYRITSGRLQPVAAAVHPGGWQVTIEQPLAHEWVVAVDDNRAVEYLQRTLPGHQATMAQWQSVRNAAAFELLQRAINEQGVPQSDAVWGQLATIGTQLRVGAMHVLRQDYAAAIAVNEEAGRRIDSRLRQSYVEAIAGVTGPGSSPFLVTMAGLPTHWQLMRIIGGRPWQAHVIPGLADAEGLAGAEANPIDALDRLAAAGWQFQTRDHDRASHEITYGGGEVRMSASARSGGQLPGGFAGATARLDLPPVEVPAGRIVRISGEVAVDTASGAPLTSVLIYDNAGTAAMGLNIDAAPLGAWRRFELLRISDSGAVQLFVELRGELSARLRNVRVESMTAAASERFLTTPAITTPLPGPSASRTTPNASEIGARSTSEIQARSASE